MPSSPPSSSPTSSRHSRSNSDTNHAATQSLDSHPLSSDGSSSDSDDSDTELPDAHSSHIQERIAQFAQIKARLRQTETDNRKDLVKQQNNQRLPASALRKLERKRSQAQDLLNKRNAESAGLDYERQQNLNYSARDIEVWDAVQAKKRLRANTDYSDAANAAHKKYNRLITSMTPDIDSYKEQQLAAHATGQISEFYGDLDHLDVTSQPSSSDVNRMVSDLNKQIEIRTKSSRRRAYNPDEDVSYINNKNRGFNQRISKAYDKYTGEIKESLERGTAL